MVEELFEFVFERRPPARLATSPGASGIATLDLKQQDWSPCSRRNAGVAHHKMFDRPVELCAVVVVLLAQLDKVLARFGYVITVQLQI